MRPAGRRYWLHALLLVLTIGTTMIVGAKLQFNYNNNLPMYASDSDFFAVLWVLADPSRILLGIPFSATLLGILFAHEMGHFYFCVRNRVYATLPYFLPAPTLIGTLGAFIRIRSRIRSRNALFDIGISGPIAGFVVAVPLLVVALAISKPLPPGLAQSKVQFSYPLIFDVTNYLLALLHIGPGYSAAAPLIAEYFGPSAWNGRYLHPMTMACWAGMFATSLNLLPSGQLDGGHILYSVNPQLHRLVSFLVAACLLLLVWEFWAGWLFWAAALFVLRVRHAPVPLRPELSKDRKKLSLCALFLFLMTFTPVPILNGGLHDVLKDFFPSLF